MISKPYMLLVVVLLWIIVFFFRYPVLALISDTDVKGWKYIGLSIDANSTNGYSYFVFKKYYTALSYGNLKDWEQCAHANHILDSYMRANIKDWNSNTSFSYVSEISDYGYKVYLQKNDKVIFIEGFADFGGAFPSKEEKQVCADGK